MIPKYFPYLIIAVLLIIIFFQRSCNKPTASQPEKTVKTIVKIDTFYQVHIDTIPSYVPKLKTIIRHDTSIFYKPDTNRQELIAQYVELAGDYFAQRTYKDTLKIDSIGNVILSDTVWKNTLSGRSFEANYKIPVVTKETIITKEIPPRTQFYLGGELLAQKQTIIQGAYIGLLLKNKKDQIFGLKGGLDIQGQPLIGISSYWKIKLHK